MTAQVGVNGGTGARLERHILVLGGVVVLGAIMTVLDLTIVNVAIPLTAPLADAFAAAFWVALGLITLALLRALGLPDAAPAQSSAAASMRSKEIAA